MHLKNVAAAFFALTLGEVAHAYEDAPGSVHPEYSLPFSYGKCYHLKSPSNQYLGHDIYGYLRFGQSASTAVFKVCANMHVCESNHRNEGVHAGEHWYLLDMEGTTFSRGRAYVAAVAKPGLVAPAPYLNQNYLQFSALNERSSYPDRSVRLSAHDSFSPFSAGLSMGLGFQNEYIMTKQWSDEGILVDFDEVNCPP
ncbi:unnamed protein product [Penicillium salamii]|uniref:Uncharacterized protein n=1 Tax=Penicillium salamii TaxID=1612424 RepID=A0A9W4IV00_9EURO|nr:unnamed protein product [Penicillium salamii]